MSDLYYIRVRGQVKGPVTRDAILAQIRRKRLGRHHELSTDAVTWRRAGDFPDLFESNLPVTSTLESVSQDLSVRETPEPVDDRESSVSEAPPGNGDGWFYARGRNKLGPVSSVELRTMLATGRLNGTELVWNQSLEDWIPIADLPQFMGSIPAPRSKDSAYHTPADGATFSEVLLGTSRGAGLPPATISKFPNLKRYLDITEGVTRLLFILGLMLIVFAFCVQLYTAIVADALELFVLIGPAILLSSLLWWFIFISILAMLEVVKVLIRIEHNTSAQ